MPDAVWWGRIGLLGLMFLIGCLEGTFLNRRDIACATWAIGLLALVAWIGYPLTTIRAAAAVTVLLTGILSMRRYYQKRVG
jgi:hypothetical protein